MSFEGRGVRVLVVDDSPECRAALAAVVAAAPGFDLAGTAGCGEDALALLSQVEPELVLVDVRMPGLDGIETARRIGESRPSTIVVLVTASAASELSSGTGTGGAVAVLPKSRLCVRGLTEVWQRLGTHARP